MPRQSYLRGQIPAIPWITMEQLLEKKKHAHRKNIERSHRKSSKCGLLSTQFDKASRMASKFNGRTSESLENRRGYSSQFSAHPLPWMSTIALTRSGRSKANCKPTWVQMTGHLCREKPAVLQELRVFQAELPKTQSRAWNQQACRSGE